MSTSRIITVSVGLTLLAAVALVSVVEATRAPASDQYDQCVDTAEDFREEFGWDPEGGIDAWCVTVTDEGT